MSDNQLTELIERYLAGNMDADERGRFDMLRKSDAVVESRLAEHIQFTMLLKQYSERLELEKRLNDIHDEIDVHALKEELTIHPAWVVRMWRQHHSKISVAASIAFFAILSTLFFTGNLNNHESNFLELRREVGRIKKTTENLDQKTNKIIKDIKARPMNPASFSGTGFALSSNGYIVTNYHVVKDADSVYIQNSEGDSYRSKVIYSEPQNDIAILQVTDPSFENLGVIPYTLKRSKSDLGEGVYTFGYPGDDAQYGEGYLAAEKGFNSDSASYLVEMSVNPGNSGGPLLDSKGNIIGIVSGKQTQSQLTAFAVKSPYLLKTIQNIPADSLSRTLRLSTKNSLAGLSRKQQIKKLKNYVFMVKVYNQ